MALRESSIIKDPKRKHNKGELHYNPSKEKKRAMKILAEAKEHEKKLIAQGYKWVQSFKGRKLVKI